MSKSNKTNQKYKVREVNLLQFISSGDDEGDGGDEHHREGEEGQELGKVAKNTKIEWRGTGQKMERKINGELGKGEFLRKNMPQKKHIENKHRKSAKLP